ncbi:glycoside hydrolase family 5 protein [Stutzerimonas nosocomialis]|uniref:glycoside hydrolase family 5 protein n=1 Tax=Stutzerimonas nosocomialis TaxID=1056496 RepID=UPI001108E6B0|nr:cellulase family glycosylhydrolase [Stutzerimonas nosocomialis]TLX53652.1 glycoside hydrolase family 5 protein [Stutzerimonas nosocomialis]TLX55018.1 glycoside hydrolase family 5 protein [Stutzerimonas nosocomialis]
MFMNTFAGAHKALAASIALAAVLGSYTVASPASASTAATTSASASVTSTLNSFTSSDWLNGIWRKSAGFSIPATSANIAAFKVGTSVTLADGQTRKVVAIYNVGSSLSVMLDGAVLDGNKVGFPKTVSTGSGAATVLHTSGINAFTNSDWLNGVWRKSAGFSIAGTDANKAAFKVGATVQLADGQMRKITVAQIVGNNMSIFLEGAALNATAVGHPKTLKIVSAGSASAPVTSNPATNTPSAPVTSTPTAPVVTAPKPTAPVAPTPTPTAPVTSTPSNGAKLDLVGVNFGSAVFDGGNVPGVYNTNYTYAAESYYKRHSELGFKLVRLGFLWERIQPKLGAELNNAELARLMQSLDHAQKYGIKVVLDMHNYYRYYGKQINTPDVPISQFANAWRLIAQKVVNHPAVYGYGLMNEPHDNNDGWPAAALAAAQAVRAVDKNRWIFVAGERWSSAYHWPSYNSRLIQNPWMRDPKNNLVYEAHMYIDSDFSGNYFNKAETFDPMIGVNRVKPFVEWLKQHKLRGFLGEHGVPDFSPSAMVATDNLLAYLRQNCIPSTYWAAGPWWGEYSMSLDVTSNKARPQLPILQKHAGAAKTCSTIGPL